MSLWSTLSGAIDNAGGVIAADFSAIPQTVLSGLTVRVKTNVGPAFTLGGQYHDPSSAAASAPAAPSTGLLDTLGFKFGAQVIDAGGNTIFNYGDMPPTDFLHAGMVVIALGVIGYTMFRGIRSMV